MMTREQREQVWAEISDIFVEEHAKFWLSTPNRHIGGRIPADCDFDEVKKLIEQVKMMLAPAARH
jgi:uncharacterized protein (DUF2384 family)